MLALWEYIEADFLRDYGLNLGEALYALSWRRFDVLLRGVSPGGAVAANMRRIAREQREEEKRDGTRPDANAQMFWRRVAVTGRASKDDNIP